MRTLNRTRKALASTLMIGVLLVFTVMVIFSPAALAYTYEGGRWNGTPTAGCCADLYVQYAAGMYTGDPTNWDNGRQAWNGTPTANIIFFKASGTSPIYLTDNNTANNGMDGMTTLHLSGGFFTSSFSTINHWYLQNYSAAKAQSVAAHELGHVGGLGEMMSGCELMRIDTATRYDNCHDNVPVLDDINGINSLY